MAAGKHQIIAFWMSPDGVSVEIKMTFSHTINFMDSFSGLSLTDLVPGHDTLYTGFLVCINENRNHMFPTGQDRGSASAHNDTAAFLGSAAGDGAAIHGESAGAAHLHRTAVFAGRTIFNRSAVH